ncbi:hypothetical protein DIPPA_21613 [Diplonema papillatum]|nr:hypothetical protein DIPPA_12785 [Diplonema papillatum]KAJ9437496.1 hypothetical protein DIPPA_21272 [Diplonema papillatum]KAJ9441557.1 hypothetical protein DIPPA_17529 [Diplonema papillatum]KAJ9448176.1 hypothetical protein DIPPA_17608 [Diplonema papillatum]KAJ9456960.1 hypothetical protein DIPPA_22302 [Diplonema papillatum]
MEKNCRDWFGGFSHHTVEQAKGVIVDLLAVPYAELGKMSATAILGVVTTCMEKDAASTTAAIKKNVTSQTAPATPVVPAPSLSGSVEAKLEEVLSVLSGIANRVGALENKASESTEPQQQAEEFPAPTLMEGLELGAKMTDGTVTAVITDIGLEGVTLVVLGQSTFQPVPHHQLKRFWKLVAAPEPAVPPSKAYVPEDRNDKRRLDSGSVRAVLHDGASWPVFADDEPGFSQLLLTELGNRAPLQVAAAAAYRQLTDIVRMVLSGEDDGAVLSRIAEQLEFWRVREKLGYQAADAFAGALEDPEVVPQRMKRAKQAAEVAAAAAINEAAAPRTHAYRRRSRGGGGRERRPKQSGFRPRSEGSRSGSEGKKSFARQK